MIYAIADLHLDYTKEKDMGVFGDNWEDYENRIFKNWEKIREDDLVLIPGDISWALRLEDAKIDLDRIDRLAGRKILLKGNHDYWWISLNKLSKLGLETIGFLQNNSFVYKNTRICGTRGWISTDEKDFSDHDRKVFDRELARLELSLQDKVSESYDETIVIMHYPPFFKDGRPNEFEDIFHKYGVSKVIYGHIHGPRAHYMPEGQIHGVEYFCVSADKLAFDPVIIRE